MIIKLLYVKTHKSQLNIDWLTQYLQLLFSLFKKSENFSLQKWHQHLGAGVSRIVRADSWLAYITHLHLFGVREFSSACKYFLLNAYWYFFNTLKMYLICL